MVAAGTRVWANYRNLGSWYRAVVARVHGAGDVLDLAYEEPLLWIEPAVASSAVRLRLDVAPFVDVNDRFTHFEEFQPGLFRQDAVRSAHARPMTVQVEAALEAALAMEAAPGDSAGMTEVVMHQRKEAFAREGGREQLLARRGLSAGAAPGLSAATPADAQAMAAGGLHDHGNQQIIADQVLGKLLGAPAEGGAGLAWTAEEQRDLDDVFSIFDLDGDGNITRREIFDACELLGIAVEGNAELLAMLDAVDKNGDDRIDSGEFSDMLMRYPRFVEQVVSGMGSEGGRKFARRRLAEKAAQATQSTAKGVRVAKAGADSAGGDFDAARACAAMAEFSRDADARGTRNERGEVPEYEPELMAREKFEAVLTDAGVLGDKALAHADAEELLTAVGMRGTEPFSYEVFVADLVS
jgi:hypothetical protein